MSQSESFGAQKAKNAQQRALRQQRAADARTLARMAESWRKEVTTALASRRSHWRLGATWIEADTRRYCAELTHVSTGRTRTIQLQLRLDSAEGRQAELLQLLRGVKSPAVWSSGRPARLIGIAATARTAKSLRVPLCRAGMAPTK